MNTFFDGLKEYFKSDHHEHDQEHQESEPDQPEAEPEQQSELLPKRETTAATLKANILRNIKRRYNK